LMENDIQEIMKLVGKMPDIRIGERYGVSRTTILAIRTGRTWSHVTGIPHKKRAPPKKRSLASSL